MSATISPGTGQRYGLRRVCRVWEMPRATVYSRRTVRPAPQRRGPKPVIPDANLLSMIREDLAASPFREEGHRKVFYRLKFVGKVKVAPKRILRLMREHSLLSPQRAPQGEPNTHDGTITTDRPLEMWGTDGTTTQVVEEGTVWIFGAVEHFNAECVGIHASKSGDRFNAMEPVKQGIEKHYGAIGRGIAEGLAVRSDHGSQYVSDHFQTELKHFGIRQSLAYVGEPQTNGVIERFWKTLKKALTDFVALYNRAWRLEKLGGRTPDEARQAWITKQAA